MKSYLEALFTFAGIIGILAIILGLPVMLLWNWLIPSIFGLTKITLWQAIGINILCTILFGNHNNKLNSEK
jgi:hypothetical protein